MFSWALYLLCAVLLMESGLAEAQVGDYETRAGTYFCKGIALTEQGYDLFGESNYTAAIQAFDEAIKAFKNALELKPNFDEAQINLANALKGKSQAIISLGNYDKAIKAIVMVIPEIDQSIENNKNLPTENDKRLDAIKSCNYGVALSKANDHNGAIEEYNKAIKIAPKYVRAWNNKGCDTLRAATTRRSCQGLG